MSVHSDASGSDGILRRLLKSTCYSDLCGAELSAVIDWGHSIATPAPRNTPASSSYCWLCWMVSITHFICVSGGTNIKVALWDFGAQLACDCQIKVLFQGSFVLTLSPWKGKEVSCLVVQNIKACSEFNSDDEKHNAAPDSLRLVTSFQWSAVFLMPPSSQVAHSVFMSREKFKGYRSCSLLHYREVSGGNSQETVSKRIEAADILIFSPYFVSNSRNTGSYNSHDAAR